jgi:hypothetical protein
MAGLSPGHFFDASASQKRTAKLGLQDRRAGKRPVTVPRRMQT